MALMKYWNGTQWVPLEASQITDGTITISPGSIGNLSSLTTTNKSSIVSATNEINGNLNTHLADLTTDSNGVHGLKVEEGTWTPYATGDELSNANVYSSQIGKYYKINKLVIVEFKIQATSVSGMTSGTLRIRGLPFVARWGEYQAGSISAISGLNYGTADFLTLVRNIDYGNAMSFYANVNNSPIGLVVSGAFTTGSIIQGTFTYTTN